MTVTTPINKAKVRSVYSGKPGKCGCGCSGTQSYRADPKLRALGGKHRGYDVRDDEVSERNVTRIVNLMNKNLIDVEKGEGYLSLETGGRMYIAYMLSEKELQAHMKLSTNEIATIRQNAIANFDLLDVYRKDDVDEAIQKVVDKEVEDMNGDEMRSENQALVVSAMSDNLDDNDGNVLILMLVGYVVEHYGVNPAKLSAASKAERDERARHNESS